MWLYQVRPVRVIDGDTVEFLIDLGYRITRQEHIRLLGVDTPELRGGTEETKAAAREARDFVGVWLTYHVHDDGDIAAGAPLVPPWPFLLTSSKGDSFGRWLGLIRCLQGHDLGQALLDAGHAEMYR